MKSLALMAMFVFSMTIGNLHAMNGTKLQNHDIFAGEETMIPPVEIPAPPK